MMRRTRGWLVEVHVELHMSLQTFSLLQSECKNGDAEAVEARSGPSILVKIWAWMISGWMSVIDVSFPAQLDDAIFNL